VEAVKLDVLAGGHSAAASPLGASEGAAPESRAVPVSVSVIWPVSATPLSAAPAPPALLEEEQPVPWTVKRHTATADIPPIHVRLVCVMARR